LQDFDVDQAHDRWVFAATMKRGVLRTLQDVRLRHEPLLGLKKIKYFPYIFHDYWKQSLRRCMASDRFL